MSWQRRFLLDQETQTSDSATRRVALPRKGALSGLELRTRITNGATEGLEKIHEAIDRVEVVADGSNVLFSLEGSELYRWGHFILKHEPPSIQDQTGGVVQELTLPVCFGRYLGDPELHLDLAAYRDVEARIQYSPTIAATSFATGTTQFHIPYWIDDGPNPPGPRRGWLRTTQVKAFDTVASGDDVTELSRLYPYWDLMVYCREAAIDDGVDLTRAQVWVNDKQVIPFDGRWDDVQAMNEALLGVDGTHKGVMVRGDTETFDTHCGRTVSAVITLVAVQSDANGVYQCNIGSVAGDRLTMSCSDTADAAASTHFTAAAADRTMKWIAKGLGVGNAILIPFAFDGKFDGALDPRDMSRLQLVLTQGAAGGTTRISTRELVPA